MGALRPRHSLIRFSASIAAAALVSATGSAIAQDAFYAVNVTAPSLNSSQLVILPANPTAANRFEPITILTEYCSTGLDESAMLRTAGSGGTLYVGGSSCTVNGYFRKIKPKAGRYKATIYRKSENWYEVLGTQTFLQTEMCMMLSETASLELHALGFGQLTGSYSSSCPVRAVFAPVPDIAELLGKPYVMPAALTCNDLGQR